MDQIAALPQSPRYAAALAHIADLRAEAERVHVARAVEGNRPRHGWPRAVVTALRNSFVGSAARPVPTSGADGSICVTC